MDGALIIDKPAGCTSYDVVARARRILQLRRIGHTGTLDPFATGVLVLLLGRATRVAQFLSGLEKEYQAVIRLGFATDTGDLTGKPVDQLPDRPRELKLDENILETALAGLRGEIDQVPPMYSAKKQQGRKLYELARRGEVVERAPVRVCVREFDPIKQNGEWFKENLDGSFDVKARVVCSAGTYVRTLAEDFGKRLGTGAHLAELRRTRVGPFTIDQARSLDQLEAAVVARSLNQEIISANDTLSHLESLEVSAVEIQRVRHGMKIEREGFDCAAGQYLRLHDGSGELIAVAVARWEAERLFLQPQVVLQETSK